MLYAGIMMALSTLGFALYFWKHLLLSIVLPAAATNVLFGVMLTGTLIEADRQRRALRSALDAEREAAAHAAGELEAARRIQMGLLPTPRERFAKERRFSVDALLEPARTVGGDFYDCFMVDANHMFFVVADVSGKGLPASLLMSNMQATLRALIGRVASIPALAGHASDLLYGATSPEKYVTAALAELAPATGDLTFVGAGHLDNVILRADGTVVPLASTGSPLGLLPPGLPYGETGERLHPGDALVLFSDGITEAQDAAGEEFRDSRLLDTLRSATGQPAGLVIDRVFEAIDAFAGGAPQFDDMTILVARRL
jgi:serine phosphatase RsbU (regulator of sigma subunit)